MKKAIICAFAFIVFAAYVAIQTSNQHAKAQSSTNSIYGKFYQYDIVAESGRDGLTGMGSGVSINDKGTVAFVGQTTAPYPVGEGVFVSPVTSTTPTNISPGFQATTRVFNPAVQINNNEQVASRDRSTSPSGSVARVWDATTGGFTTVATGTTTSTLYSSIYSFPSLNNLVDGTTNSKILNYVFGAIRTTNLTDVLVTPNAIPVSTALSSRNEITFTIQRPMISDDGQIVMRRSTSAFGSPIDPVVVYSDNFAASRVVADGNTFAQSPNSPDIGQAPGIADDGSAIAFYANLSNSSTATAMGTNTGPGIFVELRQDNGARNIVRVAGRQTDDEFDNRKDPIRQTPLSNKDGVCDLPNERCIDAELGVDDQGHVLNFADSSSQVNGFQKDSRVAVIHQSLGPSGILGDTFIVSFMAKPNYAHPEGLFSDRVGIWTVRVDVRTRTDGSIYYDVSRPLPVIQIDDKLGNRLVTGLAVYDQLAKASVDDSGNARAEHPGDHRVAFWASTTSSGGNSQVIVRSSQMDSDEDALYDHWETVGKGIDFDGDGIIDLSLADATYGASVNGKDLFVDIDAMPQVMPSDLAVARVEQAFLSAPPVPGQIKIHLLRDTSETIPPVPMVGFTNYKRFCPADNNAEDFNVIRKNHFGSVADHDTSDPNNAKRLGAKKLAFRYALFAYQQIKTASGGTCFPDDSSGVAASIPGANFLITLGNLRNTNSQQVQQVLTLLAGDQNDCLGEPILDCGLNEAMASTFMHELGHTLGLRHGGGDDTNFKPNYFSIMSYTFQFKDLDGSRVLDYSHDEMDPLDESNLNETVGVTLHGSPQARKTIWTDALGNFVTPPRLANQGPSVDWNNNGNSSEIQVMANINYVYPPDFPFQATELSILRGQNDWANLKFNFRNSMSFYQANKPLSATPFVLDDQFLPPPPSLTLTQILGESQGFDGDGDGITNLADNCPATPNPDQADLNHNGIGDVCEYAPTAASVALTGRAVTATGVGIRGAQLTLTDADGNVWVRQTSSFGYYRFDGIPTGHTYVISIAAKRYEFVPSRRVITLQDDISNVDFIASDPRSIVPSEEVNNSVRQPVGLQP